MIPIPAQARGDSPVVHQTLWTLAALWFGIILIGPIVQVEAIYTFFSAICHQLSERSWHLDGHALPVCIRCASIYFGFLLALTLRFRARVGFLRFALAAMAVEWVLARIWFDWEPTRAVSGLMLGLAAAAFVEAGVTELLGQRLPRPRTGQSGRSHGIETVS